jgi:hypothetical protein
MPVKDWVCARCTGTGDLLTMDDAGPLCMTCADLDHLVFLGAGDAALTRRAKKASGLSTVVVRWSRSRKRYERQGILVEEAALEQAEQECLADEDARLRRRERDRERRAGEDVELQARMGTEIVRLFPRCPPERAEAIVRHTALRGSGRVTSPAIASAPTLTASWPAGRRSVRHFCRWLTCPSSRRLNGLGRARVQGRHVSAETLHAIAHSMLMITPENGNALPFTNSVAPSGR